MVRFNITMPEDVAGKLGSIKNKSRFIADVLREKFKNEQQKSFEALLAEGYQAMAKEDKKNMEEFKHVDAEAWKHIDD